MEVEGWSPKGGLFAEKPFHCHNVIGVDHVGLRSNTSQ
jgi:hypothetical protein